jgi:hypothetical protein
VGRLRNNSPFCHIRFEPDTALPQYAGPLDDAASLQVGEFGRREAQPAAVDRGVVLTDGWAGSRLDFIGAMQTQSLGSHRIRESLNRRDRDPAGNALMLRGV